jgi:phosphate starvation-inducible protein PhoH and related proteins
MVRHRSKPIKMGSRATSESSDDCLGMSPCSFMSGPRRGVAPEPIFKRPEVVPRNSNQALLMSKLNDRDLPIVVACGPAGSSKTYCACVAGLRALLDGQVKKLVVTRSATPIGGEDLGFLPGGLNDKLTPLLLSVLESFYQFLSPSHVQQMIDDKLIELCPISMIRGRTFSDSWIVLDEASCASVAAFKCIITRIGPGSKLVITGDEDQSDLKGENGLSDFLRRLGPGIPGQIELVKFTIDDVVRHPIIKTVLSLYERPKAAVI